MTHTKDEALDLALMFVSDIQRGKYKGDAEETIAAIRQARAEQPAPVQPVAEYRGVTNDGRHIIKAMQPIKAGTLFYTTPPAQPAVPDAMTSADIQESIEYVAGWNDCRQAMLEMMK